MHSAPLSVGVLGNRALSKRFPNCAFRRTTMILRKIKTTLSRLRALPHVHEELRSLSDLVAKLDTRVEYLQEALGRIELRQLKKEQNNELIANEFRVFSQWGE